MGNHTIKCTTICYVMILLSIVGCTTVPVTVNLHQNDSTLDLSNIRDKSPLSIGLVIQDFFSNFTIKVHTGKANIDYDFQYDLGDDFSETLPVFFGNRFEKVVVLKHAENVNQFDYIVTPNISSSRLAVNFNNWPPNQITPTYTLEIHLEIVSYRDGIQCGKTRITEGITRRTEVGCWTCFGEKVLNQQKIRDEYSLLLSKVYSNLDSNLMNLFEEGGNAK